MKTQKISVLLPTRKRARALVTSLTSICNNFSGDGELEILIAYDRDDDESRNFFATVWPDLNRYWPCVTLQIFESERYGYTQLHRYVNLLGSHATGDWIMFWNDDAVMLTNAWDREVLKYPDYFGCLRMQCINHQHPFALFPIIPQGWVKLFREISPVVHSDWWIYNVTAPLTRMLNIRVDVYHNRADITGGNNDETYRETSYSADGKDPTNPVDYAHPDRQRDLMTWRERLARHTGQIR
jgi:glycosyltransferase involved in cell wall biosynthesis